MSIASELLRIKNAKQTIINTLKNKRVNNIR
jgi:hypothetical protein